jgi:hypothetical protein
MTSAERGDAHELQLVCRFASIAKMAGEQMEPFVAQLVPRLYR